MDVRTLFEARGLDMTRFSNLLMDQKSVNLPCEDAVSNAVNAAKPIVDSLTHAERERIEILVVGTESAVDFGKPISTYVHDYLGLKRHCRSFEVKHACYGGTAALQTASAFVSSSPVPDVKALVVATDAASVAARGTYWEPSQGAGAVAMLVGGNPEILELDQGANGYYSYEVMDTLRPRPDLEAGDSDLSLLSYLHCLSESYGLYRERVAGADILETFDYLVLHTPFAGMVRGAHRSLLRKEKGATAGDIDVDFASRVAPTLRLCVRVGNIYSAALYLALCSLIEHGDFSAPRRAGMFSYGSGCAGEFYSGLITDGAQRQLAQLRIGDALDDRYALSMEEYEEISDASVQRMCGVEEATFETTPYQEAYKGHVADRGLLILDEIRRFHRRYRWS